jgi:hypothetical protein
MRRLLLGVVLLLALVGSNGRVVNGETPIEINGRIYYIKAIYGPMIVVAPTFR